MDIKDVQKDVYKCAADHGWWDITPVNIPEKLALIHSEVSEALECYREGDMLGHLDPTGKPLGFSTELADVVIRILDLAQHLGIDMDAEIQRKHAFNLTRPFRHGNKKC